MLPVSAISVCGGVGGPEAAGIGMIRLCLV